MINPESTRHEVTKRLIGAGLAVSAGLLGTTACGESADESPVSAIQKPTPTPTRGADGYYVQPGLVYGDDNNENNGSNHEDLKDEIGKGLCATLLQYTSDRFPNAQCDYDFTINEVTQTLIAEISNDDNDNYTPEDIYYVIDQSYKDDGVHKGDDNLIILDGKTPPPNRERITIDGNDCWDITSAETNIDETDVAPQEAPTFDCAWAPEDGKVEGVNTTSGLDPSVFKDRNEQLAGLTAAAVLFAKEQPLP